MNLIIYTEAQDKTASAVTSMTDTTPLTELEQLVLGDTPTISVTFTNGTAAPSWAGQSGYTMSIALGTPDGDGRLDYTQIQAETAITGGWSGNLPLDTPALVTALNLLVNQGATILRPPTQRYTYQAPRFAWFVMQIAVRGPDGFLTTYASLRVCVLNRVITSNFSEQQSADAEIYAWTEEQLALKANIANPVFTGGITTPEVLSGTGDLTLTAPIGSDVVIANTESQTTRLDLGAMTPVPSPAAAYFQPLVWGSGSRAYLTGGYTLFTTPAYPSGVYDHLFGIGYNQQNPQAAGDVRIGLSFETLFQNDPDGADTEFYYDWGGPAGVTDPAAGSRNARRVFQSNISWGTQQAATKEMGWVNWNFDINDFTVRNGANADTTLRLDLGANNSSRSTHTMRWFGGMATFDGGITTTNLTSTVSTGSSSIGGDLTINAGNVRHKFLSGNSAIYQLGSAVSGDNGSQYFSGDIGAVDFFAVGSGGGGSLFGTGSNGYFIDMVRNTSPAKPLAIRYSNNAGTAYTSMATFTPNTGVVAFPMSGAATSSTTGAVQVAGGLGVGGAIWSADSLNAQVASGSDASVKIDAKSSNATINLNSNAVGNSRVINFTHGAAATVLWRLGYNGFYPSSWVGFYNGSGGGVMVSNNNNLLLGGSTTDMSGTYGLRLEGTTSATTSLTGAFLVGNGTAATNVGIGGGNIVAGSSIRSTSATAGLGYGTGAGLAITQLTSRTTGVTINAVCGSITLFSAAGSATYQSFTVTNSAVAISDVVHVTQRSGTDLYEIHTTATAAGSFRVTFRTTGGTTSEAPVFNFIVFKAVTA